MKRILITGARGFVGGKLCRHFCELGWTVTGLVRSGGSQTNVNGVRVVEHDLSRPLHESFSEAFDVIVHAAARSKPYGRRLLFERDNVLATRNVIDFCETTSVGKLIHVSSASVYYEEEHQFDITESTPFATKPVNHYAATKQQADNLVKNSDVPWMIARPRAVFGPGDTVLLRRILLAAKKQKLPKFVSDETPVIGDLIFIDNFCRYIEVAAESESVRGEFNLTNNEPIEINAFLRRLLVELELPLPTREMSIKKAMKWAGMVEKVYGTVAPWKEPPITRFGIHVFAYSKTFDVRKSIEAMGPPEVSMKDAFTATITHLRASAS